jgi:hypothetical protein
MKFTSGSREEIPKKGKTDKRRNDEDEEDEDNYDYDAVVNDSVR